MIKIRNIATVAICVLLPFLFYYPYEAFRWQLNMAFLEPERWLRSSWAAPGVEVSWLTRAVYFAVWSPAVLAGIGALVSALSVALLFRRGVVFDLRVARGIIWMGWFTAGSNAIHILAACVSPMIVSWHNPDGPLPLRFWYSSSNMSLVLCGLAFLMMGTVMREAIRLARENEEFV